MLEKIKKFIDYGVWQLSVETMPFWKRYPLVALRVLLVAYRGFVEDKVQREASALTFYSLLSMVPVIAVLFAIAKGFGLERKLEQQILERSKGNEDVLNQVFEFSNTMLDNTQGGLIAGIGVVVLLWSVVKLLSNIETAFNEVWQVDSARSPLRKLTEYLAIMVIAPLLIIFSTSATVFISSSIMGVTSRVAMLEELGPMIAFLLKFTPYLVYSILLTLIFMVMPNTRVRWQAALTAGILAGIAIEFIQFTYINFQFGMSRYNAIYGSFAALPLFLMWMQINWLIVLFCAEVSFAVQHLDRFQSQLREKAVAPRYRQLTALAVVHRIVRQFEAGKPPLHGRQIARDLELSYSLVFDMIKQLVASKVLNEIQDGGKSKDGPSYQPAVSTDLLTIQYVRNALDNSGLEVAELPQSAASEQLGIRFSSVISDAERSDSNVLLKSL